MKLIQLFERLSDPIAIIFGRFNPPHKGHRAAWKLMSKYPHWYVGTNASTQGPKDPLPFNIKIEAMKQIYPELDGHLMSTTSWLTMASEIYKNHPGSSLLIFTDEDWVVKALKDYNGIEGKPHGFYNFSSIEQNPTPRLSSATALRDAVKSNDREAFSNAAGIDADTEILGKPYFDLVAEYLLPYVEKEKVKTRKKNETQGSSSEHLVDSINGSFDKYYYSINENKAAALMNIQGKQMKASDFTTLSEQLKNLLKIVEAGEVAGKKPSGAPSSTTAAKPATGGPTTAAKPATGGVKPVAGQPTTKGSTGLFDLSSEPIQIGSSGPLVKAYQWSLSKLGFNPGVVDGVFGPRTKKGTISYQTSNGLEADGVVGKNTYALVNTDLKDKGITELPPGFGLKPGASGTGLDVDKSGVGLKLPSTTSIEGLDGKVLDWVSQFESVGAYDMMYGGKRYPQILDMTINEVLSFQRKHRRFLRKKGNVNASGAAGRYQFIPKTLIFAANGLGYDFDSVKFTPEVQDRLIIYILKKYRGLDQWKAGKLSTIAFLKNLSQEFASLPDPETNASYYKGVGDNKSLVSSKNAVYQLTQLRKEYS